METFSFSTPILTFAEGKWSLAVTSFDATNSVFHITDEISSFSISTPGNWRIRNYLPVGLIDRLENY